MPTRTALTGLCVGTAAILTVAVGAAQAQEPVFHFDAQTPIELGPTPVVVNVFNDGPRDLDVVRATASLDPDALKSGDRPTSVRVQMDFGGGFATRGGTLPSTGQLRLRLVAPQKARSGSAGWLTVVAGSGAETLVARRAIKVAKKSPAAAVDTWKVTSTQSRPADHDGGKVGSPLPLTATSRCVDVNTPSTDFVDGDRTVSVDFTCTDGKVQLRAGDFPGPGTYKAKPKIGDSVVEMEIRRTISMWWPVVLILLGFLLAMWAQGRLDQGWRMQQRWWLTRLPHRAAKEDVLYVVAARDTPWEKYELEPVIQKEADSASAQLDEIAQSRPLLLRYLPWPDGFMQAEREGVRKQIVAMDQLVRNWAGMPGTFAKANERVGKEPYYVTRAPKLVERALVIINAADLPVSADELTARCAEAKAVAGAFDVADDLDALDKYLVALEAISDRPPEDRALLIRARQYEREARATLRESGDSTLVAAEVGPLVQRASRLASRLPRPDADTGEIEMEAAGPSELLGIPLAAVRRLSEVLQAGRLGTGHATLILLTLAIGVWSGLAVLYNDKAWGGSYGDYVAAFVWGFGASTVIAPVVSAVKQLGTRPGDPVSPASAK
jgi:hypothetical protein